MSQENVEIVRRTVVEVANRGDVDPLDDLATADYEWHNARDLPGEQIVQLCQLHATGKGSGVTLDTPIAYVHTLRDGKFARTMAFINHAEALEAAGLPD